MGVTKFATQMGWEVLKYVTHWECSESFVHSCVHKNMAG